MRHTAGDLEVLQGLLDRSAERAGEHLRRTFELPEHSLSATQLARYFEQPRPVALATVTARGEPRVAPVHAVFYRGRFHIPTAADATRVGHVRRRPAVSLTHFVLNQVALIGHGRATVLGADHPDFALVDPLYQAEWWRSIRQQDAGVYLRIELETLYTWALKPEEFPAYAL